MIGGCVFFSDPLPDEADLHPTQTPPVEQLSSGENKACSIAAFASPRARSSVEDPSAF